MLKKLRKKKEIPGTKLYLNKVVDIKSICFFYMNFIEDIVQIPGLENIKQSYKSCK